MKSPFLIADDLFRFYHPGETEVRALRGASLSVARGETVALVGPSGSGKSTLLACLAGLDEPDGGEVTLDGRRLTRRPEQARAALRGRSIGFLAQSRNLFGHLTVAENVALQLDLRGVRSRRSIGPLLARVGLTGRARALPDSLSGGERARAGLAVALAGDPPLLLADEPTAEVDADTEAMILRLLEERRSTGGAALIATHSLAVTGRATRVLTMMDGRVESGEHGSQRLPQKAVISDLARSTSTGLLLIEAKRLTRRFVTGGQAIDAVLNARLQVRAGDRIAIMGRSGSGKSTLLSILAGIEAPSGGSIAWPGLRADIPLRPRQIGLAFQSASLLPALTALENVRLPLDIADLSADQAMEPRAALELFGVLPLADALPDYLSGGQAQRVALARALVTRPAVLLADEPTGQLDRATGQHLMHTLLQALDGTDTALLIATHDESVAALLHQRWQMQGGRLATQHLGECAA